MICKSVTLIHWEYNDYDFIVISCQTSSLFVLSSIGANAATIYLVFDMVLHLRIVGQAVDEGTVVMSN